MDVYVHLSAGLKHVVAVSTELDLFASYLALKLTGWL